MSADPDQRKCILVVEDDIASAEMLTLMLEDEGYWPRVASTAGLAIDMIESMNDGENHAAGSKARWRPDLVLLDLQLPDRDGTAIIRHFSDSSRPFPPVIVLSAWRIAAVEEAALMVQAAGVVLKPFDMATLLGSIATVLAQSATNPTPLPLP